MKKTFGWELPCTLQQYSCLFLADVVNKRPDPRTDIITHASVRHDGLLSIASESELIVS